MSIAENEFYVNKMFSPCKYLCSCAVILIISAPSCHSEMFLTTSLVLYSPGEPEYLDVLVRRVNDSITLICELRGDVAHRDYVWNYVPSIKSIAPRPLEITPTGPAISSTMQKSRLQVSDSGHYMCSAPPYSVTKFVAVQNKGPINCARGAFTCGARCVLPTYVCDGRNDCEHGEDESTLMCQPGVCSRPEKLNCSSGRCISSMACCRGAAPLCRQPDCCLEYARELPHDGGGLIESEFPPLYEDHRAPDDYGFIQSTIYTVTACALIFMIAVVLLVSAICKMQMKRAALRGYTHADRAAGDHYSARYHQAHTFPPCYEASRLLEDGITLSPSRSPTHQNLDMDAQRQSVPEPTVVSPARGLARLTSIFSSRYRQVPTHPDVELTSVPPSPSQTSPLRTPLPLNYRSPTYCELNTELLLSPEEMGRELNYMATPVELFRRRNMRRNTLERIMDQIDNQRLTLQLGRFQLSIPRLGRTEPRPDTPVAESRPLDSLDLLRIDARDTYTLNGRTIRLLGADIQHYPGGPTAGSPPSYTEAVRYKLYGPPPEYLSREGLNRQSTDVDHEATANVEMPPRYDDLASSDVNGNGICGSGNATNGDSNVLNGASGVNGNSEGIEDVGACALSADAGITGESNIGAVGKYETGVASDVVEGNCDSNSDEVNGNKNNTAHTSLSVNGNTGNIDLSNCNIESPNANIETLSSIIDNLPAIDSDVNANEDATVNNDHVIPDNVVMDVEAT